MCGNGVRVVARYLQHAGLIDGAAAVATRGGVKQVRFEPNGDVTVAMGHARSSCRTVPPSGPPAAAGCRPMPSC